jgi:hypothetical protein
MKGSSHMLIEPQERSPLSGLMTAPKGTVVIYHTGLLAKDREKNKEADAAAHMAWGMQMAGIATLVQKRIGVGVCQYIAKRI